MFVAFLQYTSLNGFNKVYVPRSNESEGRRVAFDTQEQAQSSLDYVIGLPLTDSLAKNGYRTFIVDLETSTVITNSVAAVPEEQSSEATA